LGWRVALLHTLRPAAFAAPPAVGDDLLLKRGGFGANRAQLRDELTRQLWRRYRRLSWIVPLVAAFGAGAGILLWRHSTAAAPIIGTLTAIGGVVGITRASMIATVKRGRQT
jgi:hypothetical protein